MKPITEPCRIRCKIERVSKQKVYIAIFAVSNFFKLSSNECATAIRVSFKILGEIAAAGKSFTKGEFIKKCMLSAVSLIWPNEIIGKKTRIEDIAENTTERLRKRAMKISFIEYL